MIKPVKIAIIGIGHVGAHVGYALIMKGLVDELYLVDKNKQKAISECQDLRDCVAYAPHNVKVEVADYGDLADIDIIVNSCGKIELLETHNRLDELEFNIKAVNDWVPKVMAGGFDGMFINISNPCDIITNQIAKLSGLPKNRVFGTGTGLDTSRLLSELSRQTGVDHKSIGGYMMGEHGASIMFPMSHITFNSEPLQVLAKKDDKFKIDYMEMKNKVHDNAWVTYTGKKCTEYGICTTLAKCVEAVLHNTHSIIPTSVCLDGQYGREGLYIGVPAVIGANGVEQILELELPEDELKLFQDCCDSVLKNMEPVDTF